MGVEGGEPVRIGAGIEAALFQPAWSPDGAELAVGELGGTGRRAALGGGEG